MLSKEPNRGVIIAYFSNPQHTPPVMNTIQALSRDYRVTVVARNVLPYTHSYPANVRIRKSGRYLDRGDGQRQLYRQIGDVMSFVARTCAAVRAERPRAVLAFDMHAAVASWAAWRSSSDRPTWLYHQNETSLLAEIPRRRPAHWLKRLELRLASLPDLISLPEPNRARLFLKDAHLDREYALMENCPPTVREIPSPIPWLADLKKRGHRIVVYQGAIGPGIDVDLAIRSVRFWPKDALFVVVGCRSEAQREQLMRVAHEEAVVDRVMTVPFISSSAELLQHTAAADVGLVLYRGGEMNTRYAAPNKLYEYLACGVPVVVSGALPHLSSIVSSLGVGRAYRNAAPESLGETVSCLLEEVQTQEMGKHARQLHLSRFNFEAQFQPLLDAIEG